MMTRTLIAPLAVLALLTLLMVLTLSFRPRPALAQSQSERAEAGPQTEQATGLAPGIDAGSPVASEETPAENIAEREVLLFLQNLRQRERELDAREEALQNETQALESITAELEARYAELQAIRDEINEQLAAIDAARAERITALGRWYAAMEPTEAADQLATQQIQTIVDIFMTMEDRRASAVLESMSVEVAAQVVEEMSRRN